MSAYADIRAIFFSFLWRNDFPPLDCCHIYWILGVSVTYGEILNQEAIGHPKNVVFISAFWRLGSVVSLMLEGINDRPLYIERKVDGDLDKQ